MTIPGWRVFAALSRRVRTLIVSGVAFLVLLILAFTMPVPYVVLSPGPTCNTIGSGADCQTTTIIMITGTTPNKTTGHLNLTTVDVTLAKQSAFDVLRAWLSSDEIVVPSSSVNPPGQSQQQTNHQNTEEFTDSQNDAIVAASCELGYARGFGVAGVVNPGPSVNKLQPTDLIKTLNGGDASNDTALAGALAKLAPGTKVELGIVREGKPQTVQITLGKPTGKQAGGILGIDVTTVCQLPFSVQLGLGSQIGGPSAGLMFALGILDKVGKVDLTHGEFIAGTGEIDDQNYSPTAGVIDPIGGIALKMIAARRAGATVFLAPAGNCGDVKGVIPKGLNVIKVTTVHDAVTSLEALHEGKPVPHCPT